ncbi:MAG: hypothetical protein ACYDCQ_15685 [Dehalococcoidia bacterium]
MESVRRIRSIVRDIGKNGVTSASVILPERDQSAEITRELEANLDTLVGIHHRSLGAVEGRLEAVSLHRGATRFYVYNTITNRGVRCNLPKDIEDDVLRAISDRRRVAVTGVIAYNAVSEPISVKVERLRILEKASELPTVREMLGAIPDLTENLSTKAHIRMLRDG